MEQDKLIFANMCLQKLTAVANSPEYFQQINRTQIHVELPLNKVLGILHENKRDGAWFIYHAMQTRLVTEVVRNTSFTLNTDLLTSPNFVEKNFTSRSRKATRRDKVTVFQVDHECSGTLATENHSVVIYKKVMELLNALNFEVPVNHPRGTMRWIVDRNVELEKENMELRTELTKEKTRFEKLKGLFAKE